MILKIINYFKRNLYQLVIKKKFCWNYHNHSILFLNKLFEIILVFIRFIKLNID